MLSAALVASLLMSAPAADQPNAMDKMEHKVVAELTGDQIGDGPVIELDVYTLSGGSTGLLSSAFGVAGTNSSPVIVTPAVQVGYEWDQNNVLIGLQMIFIQGTATVGGVTNISFPITYRRYMKPLVVNGFDPFVEAAGTLAFVVPSNSNLQIGFGADVGFGGEWLFTRNFGLMGKVLLGYQHIPATISGQDINAFGIGGVLGVLIHF
jgi:hypothetical protein